MTYRVAGAALGTALLASVPVLYPHFIWPTVRALVPTHYSGSGPDHFVARGWVWNIV